MKKFFHGVAFLGLILMLCPLAVLYYEDRGLNDSIVINFQDPSGVTLAGTYFPGSIPYGIILSHGYAGDQTIMKGIATEYYNMGFNVFTYDFEGHGRSQGAMELIYTTSDRLAKQVLAAKDTFKKISGLKDSEIILFGYSMGARVSLQSTYLDKNRVKMLVLLGCYINLEPRAQTFTHNFSTDNELKWVKSLSEDNPDCDVLLITGELDDVSTLYRNELLFQKLGGEHSSKGIKYRRELKIIENLIHPYEPYSMEAISYSINWIMEEINSGEYVPYMAKKMVMRKLVWTVCSIGLFIFIIGGLFILKQSDSNYENQKFTLYHAQEFSKGISLINLRKFVLWKIFLWIISIPLILAIMLLLLFLPLNFHYFAFWGVIFIGVYNFLMLLLYSTKNMPGTNGEFKKFIKKSENRNWKDISITILLILFFISISTLLANSGLFYVFPFNDRLIWLMIFTSFLIPSFYIVNLELNALQNIKGIISHKKIYRTLIVFIELIPFFIYVGWVASIHGVLILLFSLSGSFLIHKIGKNPFLTVFFQAFLLNYLLLPQGVLYPSIF